MYYEILQTVQTMKKYLIKKSQKIADILIEDSHPYIAELVENIPKIGFLVKSTGRFLLVDWIPFMYILEQ